MPGEICWSPTSACSMTAGQLHVAAVHPVITVWDLKLSTACPACRTTDPGSCGLYLGRPCTFNDALITRVSPVPRLNFTSIQSSSGLQGNCSFNPSNDVSRHICHITAEMLTPHLAAVMPRWLASQPEECPMALL